MKPNLFIVGAPKCGTSAWWEYLRSHPDIFFPMFKEPHYFSTDFPEVPKFQARRMRREAVKNIDEYLALFENSIEKKIVGEASTRYLYSEVAARNIRRFNPEARILIFLRSQPEYLSSQHNHMLFNGSQNIGDFRTAWSLSEKRESAQIPPNCPHPRFLDYRASGRFREQVERYFDQFPPEQIRVFHFSDWIKSPRETYVEILQFLGLEDDGRTDFPRVNRAKRHRNKFSSMLVQNPPRLLVDAVNRLKRTAGVSSLGVGGLLHRQGSVTQMDEQLAAEIREYYRADNLLLEHRIWRPDASRSR